MSYLRSFCVSKLVNSKQIDLFTGHTGVTVFSPQMSALPPAGDVIVLYVQCCSCPTDKRWTLDVGELSHTTARRIITRYTGQPSMVQTITVLDAKVCLHHGKNQSLVYWGLWLLLRTQRSWPWMCFNQILWTKVDFTLRFMYICLVKRITKIQDQAWGFCMLHHLVTVGVFFMLMHHLVSLTSPSCFSSSLSEDVGEREKDNGVKAPLSL